MADHTIEHHAATCRRRTDDLRQGGILLVDARGDILAANAALCSLLGYEAEELAGRSFLDISTDPEHPDAALRKKVGAFKLYYFQRAESHPLSMKLFGRGGSAVPVTMRSAITRDSSGAPAIAAAVIEPIGQPARQQAANKRGGPIDRQHLWAVEQNYRSLLENSGDGILITDFNSLIITANHAMAGMLGYESTRDIEGRYLLELAPLEGTFASATGEQVTFDAAYYQSQIDITNRLFDSGHASSTMYMAHKRGHVVPVEATMSLLTDPEGGRRGTIAICRDITQRQITEKQTREAKLFMENVFETTRDGIYVTDSLGRTVMVNQAFSDITGYTQSELIGIEPASLLPEEADIAVTSQIINAMSNRDDMSLFETKWQRKDGTIFPVEVCLAVRKNADGDDNGIVATVRDITERVLAQEALQRSYEELEHKVKERTESLEDMNTALRVLLKGREEDKQSNEEKILANINELVLPYLNRLKSTRLDERQRASLAIIEANLKDIIAPFGTKAAARNLSLTPSEIQIANLIKHGMTAKEIAGITSLSPRTIECHRASIRKKLGIKNRKVNLRVFLLSSY